MGFGAGEGIQSLEGPGVDGLINVVVVVVVVAVALRIVDQVLTVRVLKT